MSKNYIVILATLAFCSLSSAAPAVNEFNLSEAFSSHFNGHEQKCPIDANKKFTTISEGIETGYNWALTFYGTNKSILTNFIGGENVKNIEKALINFGIVSISTALITYATYALLNKCLGLAPWSSQDISMAAWIVRGASLYAARGIGTVVGIGLGTVLSPEVQKKLIATLEELGFKSS